MYDLSVKINVPICIEFIHEIEKQLDDSLIQMGFTRESTTKSGNLTEINYRQFGVSL